MSCPHLLLLSQLADGELPADEAVWIDAHVGTCELCSARLARLRHAFAAAASAAVRAAELPITARAGCLSASALAGWRDHALPEEERAATARHLESCDACLEEALAATHLLARLDATPAVPVPAALQARVATLWPEAAAEEPTLSRLIVRVTRAGAELLESHLLAPLRDLVELAAPLPAMRGGSAASTLSFKLHASDAIITTTVAPAGDNVGLTVVLEDVAGAALVDQRVFLRRHGRSIYSARTDVDGMLRMPGLERGVYEVTCPGIGASFRLDLRR